MTIQPRLMAAVFLCMHFVRTVPQIISETSFRWLFECVSVMFVRVKKLSDKYNENTWLIIPAHTPVVVRHCSKCNKKMDFYCSEKFRVNGNHAKLDIWLIYKCSKCETTWKLTIKKGVKPRDLPAELLDRFFNNDAELAWKYAFDRQLLKRNACEINCTDVKYTVEGVGLPDFDNPLLIHLKSLYTFDLKLSAFLADMLGISIGGIKKLADSGMISASPEHDIMKYRIRADIDLFLQPRCFSSIECLPH